MRTTLLVLLVACGAPMTTQRADPAAGEFLEALRAHDLERATGLLSTAAHFSDPTGDVTGAAETGRAVGALKLSAAALIDKHHDVARLSLSDDSLLFVKTDGQGAIVDVLRFPPQGTEPVGAAIKAYQDAWNVESGPRRAMLEKGWGLAARYVDANAEGRGIDELSRVIDAFRAQFRGARVDAATELQRLPAGWVTFNWTITSGASVLAGFDVGQVDEQDRLRFVAGFFSPR